jgi:hypothetical protein
VLPDFVILGVHKGGTTALYQYLIDHPQVVAASTKELHYFYRHYDGDPDSYRAMLPTAAQLSLVARRHGRAITGEASPSYISHPRIPQRAATMIPDAKLIVLLRNPVDRAVSAFHHNVKRTDFEDLTSFEAAVDRELEELPDELDKLIADPAHPESEYFHHCYLRRGVYVDQLRWWHEQYPPEQLLVLQSEELSRNPEETFAQVEDYLGIDRWMPSEFQPHNTNEYDDLDPALRSRLEEYFAPHNERLFEYLGRRFDW